MFRRCSLLLVLAVLAFAAPFARAQDQAPFENVLPESTLGYATARSVPKLLQSLKEAGWGDLFDEAEVKSFVEGPLARLRELTQSQVGLSTDQILDIFRGQVSLALISVASGPGKENPDEKDYTPHVVLMIDVGDHGATLLGLLAQIEAKVKEKDENAFQRVEEEFAGTRIVGLLPGPAEDRPQPAPGDGVYYTVYRGVFIAGGPLEAVKQVIGGLANPPAASLAGKGSYAEMVQRTGQDMELFLYLDVAGLVAVFTADKEPQRIMPVNLLGLDTVRSLGAANTWSGHFMTSRIVLKTNGEKRGLLAALTPPAGELYSAADVPPEAHLFWTVRLDLPRTWAALRQTISSVSPQAEAVYQQGLAAVSQRLGQPFDPEREIVAVFGSRVGGYQVMDDSAEAKPRRSLVLVDIQSKAAFENLWAILGRLQPQLAQNFRPQDYMGHTLNVFTPPLPPGQQPPPGAKFPTFCVLENQLVVSDCREEVERHLRTRNTSARSLKDVAGFQVTSSRLPDDPRGVFIYGDSRKELRQNLADLRQRRGLAGIALRRLAEAAPPLLKPLIDSIDLEKLPSAEVIAPYLLISSTCFIPQDDGLAIVEVGIPARHVEKREGEPD